jgi:hypothetical protein
MSKLVRMHSSLESRYGSLRNYLGDARVCEPGTLAPEPEPTHVAVTVIPSGSEIAVEGAPGIRPEGNSARLAAFPEDLDLLPI